MTTLGAMHWLLANSLLSLRDRIVANLVCKSNSLAQPIISMIVFRVAETKVRRHIGQSDEDKMVRSVFRSSAVLAKFDNLKRKK